MDARAVPRSARRTVSAVTRRVRTELDWLASRRESADVAVFHEFEPPPAGGGHQFLRALSREIEGRGLVIENNRISGTTSVCLFNSFNFDFRRLRRFVRPGVRMVHRVDGPIGAYRGFDDGTDRRIAGINHELADATVLQSRYSLSRHRELGYELRDPVVIPNAVDPEIFHPPVERDPVEGRPVRVIASSWSENPRKGSDVLRWLDGNLDLGRFSMTFVGQTQASFHRIRCVGPLDSRGVARLLQQHDVYLAPSRDDPCSNALLEALACGLPAAYLSSGGHPELVGEAGLAFSSAEDVPLVLEQLAADLEGFRSRISIPSLASVAERYLEVLGLGGAARP